MSGSKYVSPMYVCNIYVQIAKLSFSVSLQKRISVRVAVAAKLSVRRRIWRSAP